MRLRGLLTIANALIVGCVIGWAARTHSLNDRWMSAKIDKYETETSYWLKKLNNEIQDTKNTNEKESKHVKR